MTAPRQNGQTGQTVKAAVFGWPARHSLSPRLHGFWLKKYGIDGTYEAIEVAPEDFPARLAALAVDGFAGCNVTVPHKETALEIVDRADENARRIGAVNTVVVEADGTLTGTNTDGFGFMENLQAGAPGFDASAGPAVLLGAGGAARAVVAALLDAGCPDVRIVNRTRARAEAVRDHLKGAVSVHDWSEREEVLGDAVLLVNTTTMGMDHNPPLDIDLGALPKTAIVTDIVYTPLATPLLVRAQEHGNLTVDGLGMLLHQARPGFEAWFGVAPEVTADLRAHVLAALGSG